MLLNAIESMPIANARERFPESDRTDATFASPRGPLPSVYWAYWVVILLLVATEFCILLWGADFLATVVGLSRPAAATMLSPFLGAVVVGRAVASQLTLHVSSPRLFLGALAVAGISFPVYWLASLPPPNIGGLFVAGLGVADPYPLALSLTVGTAPDNGRHRERALFAGLR